MVYKKHLFLFFLIIVSATALFSQNKTALLIANGEYDNFSSLSNPVPEARQFRDALKRLGFEVTLITDASKEEMLDNLDDFESSVRERGGIALFHYGGHAVQVDGINYLVPATAEIRDEGRVKTRAVDVEEVMVALESSGSDTSIVILDSCRNNPLPAGEGRSASRGLAVAGRKPPNSIIVFSAESGTTAMDGVFTPTLLEYIETPGLSLVDVLQRTRKAVYEKTNGEQTPGSYDQLFDPVYLAGIGKQTGLLILADQRGLDLKIDGRDYGPLKTDLYSNISTGNHYLELSGSGLFWSGDVQIVPDETVTVQADVNEVGTVSYSITRGCSGILTGNGRREEFTGTGSIKNLPVGTYNYTVSGDDYKTYTESFTVYKARTVRISPNMEYSAAYLSRLESGEREIMMGKIRELESKINRLTVSSLGTVSGLRISLTSLQADCGASRFDFDDLSGKCAELLEDLDDLSFELRVEDYQQQAAAFRTTLNRSGIVDDKFLEDVLGLRTKANQMGIPGAGIVSQCEEIYHDGQVEQFLAECEGYKQDIYDAATLDQWKRVQAELPSLLAQTDDITYGSFDTSSTESILNTVLKRRGTELYKEKLDELSYLQQQEEERISGINTAGWSLFGVGTSSLAACGVFVGLAQAAYADYKESEVTGESTELHEQVELYQILYWVTGGTGLLLDAIGLPLGCISGDIDEINDQISAFNVELMKLENDL